MLISYFSKIRRTVREIENDRFSDKTIRVLYQLTNSKLFKKFLRFILILLKVISPSYL